MSLIKRNILASGSGHASGSVVNGSATPQSRSTHVHHKRHRHGRPQQAGYGSGSYIGNPRRSGFGSRQPMFRVR